MVKTPKAFANVSPGFERKRKPWVSCFTNLLTTLKGLAAHTPNPFRVGFFFYFEFPRVGGSQPWAQISKRLRRNRRHQFMICILTQFLNLTGQNGMTQIHIAGIRGFLNGTLVEKRHSAAQRPTGFAGSPHGVRSRKVLLDMR